MKILSCLFFLIVILFSCSKEPVPDNEDLQELEIIITENDSIPYEYFYSIDFDNYNNLWLQTIIEDTSVHIPPYSSFLPMKSLLIKHNGEKYIIYDGLTFKDFFFDSDGKLWLYNGSRLFTFDEKNKQIEIQFEVEEESYIEKVCIDYEGYIWIEGSKDIGILKQNGNGWEKQYSPSEYYAFHIEKNGDTYFTVPGNEIIKYSQGETSVLKNFSIEDMFLYQRKNILTDNSERLWVGVGSSKFSKISLVVFENDEWEINNPVYDNGEEPLQEVEFMFFDKKDRLWVLSNIIENDAVLKNELFVFEDNTWKEYPEFKNDEIRDFAFDINNELWLSTYKNGVYKIDH